MAGFNYRKSQGTAHKLLDKFGAQGFILRYPNYTPEPVTLAVLNYQDRQIDGTRILAQDRLIYISPLNQFGGDLAEPHAEQDRIQDARGEVYEIIQSRPVRPGTTAVLFEVQGRA